MPDTETDIDTTEVSEPADSQEVTDGVQEGREEGQEGEGGEEEAGEGGEAAPEGADSEGDSETGEEGAEEEGEDSGEGSSFDVDGEEWTVGEAREFIARANEVFALKKDAEQKVAMFNQAIRQALENPADHLYRVLVQKHGGNEEAALSEFNQIAEQAISARMKRDGMSEEDLKRQKELEQLRRDREELERLRQEKQERANQEAVFEATKTMLAQITPALAKVGLPNKDRYVREVAQVMQNARSQGYDIPVERAAKLVKKEFDKALAPDWDSLSPEAVPESVKKKILEAEISALRKKRSSGQDSDEEPAETGDGAASSFEEDKFLWRR